MKKLFAILLTLAMLLGLAACGTSGGNGSGNGGGEVTIVGTWEGTLDMTAVMAAATQMEFDKTLEMGLIFTFNEDGTYSATVDKDSLEDMMDVLVDVMIELFASISGDPDMDLEAELAKEGMTMADFKEQLMGEMNIEELLGETEATGYYKYEDGKLYTAEDKEDLEAGDYIEITHITLTSNKMTFTDIEQDGEEMSEVMPDMLPIVFTRK